MSKFYLEDRLRSFARMVTGNYKLKVIFTGTEASITTNQMFIPPLENTAEAFSLAKFLVAHESGHDLFSIMDLKKKASEKSILLGDILNSLEDARIERLITQRFEGLDALFDTEVRKIIDGRDYSKVPLPVQVLNGLYMMGKGYDISPITKQAQDLISGMKDLVEKAVNAKDNRGVLKISEQIYEKLKHLEDEHKSANPDRLAPGGNALPGGNLPDMVIESLDKHKLDQDYDNMGDYPFLKDENVDEEETEILQDKYHISEYLPLIRFHTRHQSYLIQQLRSIVETRRRRTRKRTVQAMRPSGSVDIKRLWKLATGEDRVMKQRFHNMGMAPETDPDSLAIYVLLDESHSMNTASRIRYSTEAVAVLGEVLHELKISFAITGYSTRGGGLKRYLYKQFDESYPDVKTRLVGTINREGTYTSEHIPYALRRLEGRKERKRILLVATDAEEIESVIRFRRAVELTKDAGVELLGLGINTNSMAGYFQRFTELTDLNRFGEELLKLLRGVIQ